MLVGQSGKGRGNSLVLMPPSELINALKLIVDTIIELFRVKRLHQVVVGTGFKTADTVVTAFVSR